MYTFHRYIEPWNYHYRNKKLKKIKYDLGGGGFYPLLFFIVKYIKPNIVVETGVAAGFSSYAILKAIEENKKGRLYSSDFPYFRIPNPEKYIGIIVPEKLKKSWDLLIDGDNINPVSYTHLTLPTKRIV